MGVSKKLSQLEKQVSSINKKKAKEVNEVSMKNNQPIVHPPSLNCILRPNFTTKTVSVPEFEFQPSENFDEPFHFPQTLVAAEPSKQGPISIFLRT